MMLLLPMILFLLLLFIAAYVEEYNDASAVDDASAYTTVSASASADQIFCFSNSILNEALRS